MRKGAPADRGPMIPKYKNPKITGPGRSPQKKQDSGKFSEGAKLMAYAHSRKGRTNGH